MGNNFLFFTSKKETGNVRNKNVGLRLNLLIATSNVITCKGKKKENLKEKGFLKNYPAAILFRHMKIKLSL